MGLPLGLLIGLGGFLQPTPARMVQALLMSILVAVAFALAFALGGLAYGYWQTAHIDPAAYRGWFIPPGVDHLRRFLCAGYMHNAAYLGGALVIPVAWVFLFLIYWRARNSVAPV